MGHQGEANIQLPTDGLGKKVKNFLLRGVVQQDGTVSDVYVQCASIVDQDGYAVSWRDMIDELKKITDELKKTKWMLATIFGHEGLNVAADIMNEEENHLPASLDAKE